ncbi:uncharacterized protein ACIB01_017862 isoform 2-T2 [Guaruba guarouba]
MASQKTTKKDLLKAEEQQQGSAVDRVTSLPLLNSAFNLVSSAYNYTKETHPCLSGVCSVAETVAAVAVGSMVGGAQPILNQLEPQIALVNEYACKGLDQLEENLPFLQQPADKVISDTKQLVSTKVTSAMDAACEAKEAMANKVTEAVDLTKNVVGDSVKLTRSVVTSTINSAVEAAHGAKDLVTNKVTEAVDLGKHMVEDSIAQTKSAVASTIVNAVEAAQGAKDVVTTKVTTKVTEAVEAAQGAKDLVTTKVTEAVDLSKHMVEDSIAQTKSAVASTIVNAVEAAQGAKDVVTNKVTEAVDLSKHMVEDSIAQTKSAVASTIASAVEAAQGAKDMVTNKVTTKVTEAVEAAQGAKDLVTSKVTEAVDLSKHMVEDSVAQTKSAVVSTIVNAVEAAQGAKDVVTNKVTTKVTEAVDLSKHMVEDSIAQTKSAVASTITAAVEAAQGAKDLVTNKVTEAMDLTKGAVQDSVEKTKSVVTSTVSTALDAAYGTITSKINTALEQGKEALQEGVEMTNSVVTNSISKAKAVSQAVGGGVEAVLGMSEDLVDHYLPMTDEELGKLATSEGSGMASVEEQRQNKSYFVRLGSLPNKVRRRAYHLSLHKLQRLRQSTQETLSRLQLAIKLVQTCFSLFPPVCSLPAQLSRWKLFLHALPAASHLGSLLGGKHWCCSDCVCLQSSSSSRSSHQIESVKGEVGQKLLDGQEKLYQLWLDWSLTQPKGNQVKTASQVEVESRTLTMLHIITRQLQPVYENLKASIQGLPSNIQEAVYQATRKIHQLHRSFSSAVSFQDLSSTTLTQSQDWVAEARRSLDVLFEYVTQNTPLNWVVGPFRAVVNVPQGSRKQKKKDSVPPIKSPVLDKAASSKEGVETPKEPKGAQEILVEVCELLEKLGSRKQKKKDSVPPIKPPVLDKATSSKEGAKTAEEPKGAQEILGEGHEVLEKLEEKAEKDTEVALPAKEVTTKAPEEDL